MPKFEENLRRWYFRPLFDPFHPYFPKTGKNGLSLFFRASEAEQFPKKGHMPILEQFFKCHFCHLLTLFGPFVAHVEV